MDDFLKIKKKKNKKFQINIKGLDIDLNEYQEIILSNSNHPDKIIKNSMDTK